MDKRRANEVKDDVRLGWSEVKTQARLAKQQEQLPLASTKQ